MKIGFSDGRRRRRQRNRHVGRRRPTRRQHRRTGRCFLGRLLLLLLPACRIDFAGRRGPTGRKFKMAQPLQLLLAHLLDGQRLFGAQQRHFLTFDHFIPHDFSGAGRRVAGRVQFARPVVLVHRRFFFLFSVFVVTVVDVVVVVFVVVHHGHIGEILLVFAEEFGVGPADLGHDQLVALLVAQHLAAGGGRLDPLLQLVLQVEAQQARVVVVVLLAGRGRRRSRRKGLR